MSKVRKLTPEFLYKLVMEEKDKLEKDLIAVAKKTKEVDADEFADTLEKHVDHLAVLKIKEERLTKQIRQIQEERKALHIKIRESKKV